MTIPRLPGGQCIFPHPLQENYRGIVAAGGDLSTESLRAAYAQGIFPWYSAGEPLLWWFPDPRCVLYPQDLKVSHSLKRVLRQGLFKTTIDRSFAEVIEACQTTPRRGQPGTWITSEMLVAYYQLHKAGIAHSVEVWLDDQLVGGLYGVALGRIFFGESMFTGVSNASKVALTFLVDHLVDRGFHLVDCQQDTPHMRSLGATVMSAVDFYRIIRTNQLSIVQGEDIFTRKSVQ